MTDRTAPARRTARLATLAAAACAMVACAPSGDGDAGTTATIGGDETAPAVAITARPAAGRAPEGSEPAATATTTALATAADVDAPALSTLLEAAAPLRRFSLGEDTFGVWVCRVGLNVTDPVYHDSDLRIDLDPVVVADLLTSRVTPYFEALSHGQYTPHFVAGGEVSISGGQRSIDCVDQAREAAPDSIDGLVVVADAEHGADQAGGWGRPGDLCPADEAAPCPARGTGRAAYVGASDFHPDWGTAPLMDLVEHEIGHTLGLPHSGDDNRHTSALDLMSNSAAPRDVDPDRRDGPDTLAVNRLAAGWLPLDAVVVASDDPAAGDQRAALVPSAAPAGVRLLVLPIDDLRFLTVEVLTATGFDDHLPESGVAVHLVDQRPAACRTDASPARCVNELRRQTPLGSREPHTDLLDVGDSFSAEGWRITVTAAGDADSAVDTAAWTVTVAREDD